MQDERDYRQHEKSANGDVDYGPDISALSFAQLASEENRSAKMVGHASERSPLSVRFSTATSQVKIAEIVGVRAMTEMMCILR